MTSKADAVFNVFASGWAWPRYSGRARITWYGGNYYDGPLDGFIVINHRLHFWSYQDNIDDGSHWGKRVYFVYELTEEEEQRERDFQRAKDKKNDYWEWSDEVAWRPIYSELRDPVYWITDEQFFY